MTPLRPDNPPHRILVVDDEEIVLVALRETLSRQGYEVITATNPVAGLEQLQQHRFAVIISDQQMPKMSGLDFLARVKQLQPDAARILITAVLSLDTVIDAINKGEIYRFIVKPWLREELLATVKNAAGRYELIVRNAQLQEETFEMNQKLAQLNDDLEDQVRKVAEQNEELASLNDALQQNLEQSVQLCLRTMETFYPTLGSQARRVHEICRAMADVLDLPEDAKQSFLMAAWLHDIGLIGTPRQLIKKWQQDKNGLTEMERAMVQQHPVLGAELATFVHHLKGVGVIIRSHHERFDGNGYPDGLAGENIPWLSRLLAVAVAYCESNAHSRDALEYVKYASGSAFDPEAVRTFLRALPSAAVPRKEREVLLSELRPGMILAKGIYTSTGLLLIPEGQELSELSIDKLRNHNRMTPISQALLVYC